MAFLSVLTANVQNGQEWKDKSPDDAPIRLDRTIDFLLRTRADIINLQEVEFPFAQLPEKDDHRFYNVLRERLGQAGYHSCFAYPETQYPHIPFGIGLATFSRFPIESWEHVSLPAADIRFPFDGKEWHAADRSLVSCTIRTPKGRIRVFNTHLQAFFMIGSSADEHPAQRDIVSELVRASIEEGLPTILTGDFNCTPKEHTLAVLSAAGVKTLQKRIITWRRMPLVIDHIMVSSQFRMKKFRVVDSDISDHLPLMGWLEY